MADLELADWDLEGIARDSNGDIVDASYLVAHVKRREEVAPDPNFGTVDQQGVRRDQYGNPVVVDENNVALRVTVPAGPLTPLWIRLDGHPRKTQILAAWQTIEDEVQGNAEAAYATEIATPAGLDERIAAAVRADAQKASAEQAIVLLDAAIAAKQAELAG